MAPLAGENRILVAAGLRLLRERPRPGLRALAAITGLPDGVRRAADIGHRLSPRLNAPGRLGAAQLALDLLLAEDDQSAEELARRCDDANLKRQQLSERACQDAYGEAEHQMRNGHAFLVVSGDGWASGVVGIVAARLVDRFGRPACAIAFDGETGRGSLRAPPGIDLAATLRRCGDLLVRSGGHAAAAGLTVEKRHLPALRERLGAAARAALGESPPARPLKVDAELSLGEVDPDLAAELQRFEPFGVANPEPLFGTRGVVLYETRVVGEKHLQVTLKDGDHLVGGIGFGLADRAEHQGGRVRAAYFPELDVWNGATRLRVRLRDLSPEPQE